jgi:hypothetical protein
LIDSYSPPSGRLLRSFRDRKNIVSQFIYKSDIIQGEKVIYLDDIGTKHLTFLIIPDEDINTSTTIISFIEILGPITQSRAQQLNHQVNSFLCYSAYNIESRLLPNDLIILRNQGKDHVGQAEHQEGVEESRRHA